MRLTNCWVRFSSQLSAGVQEGLQGGTRALPTDVCSQNRPPAWGVGGGGCRQVEGALRSELSFADFKFSTAKPSSSRRTQPDLCPRFGTFGLSSPMIRFPSSSASCPGTGARDGICWEECRYIPVISKKFFTVINSVQIPAHLPTYLHEASPGSSLIL